MERLFASQAEQGAGAEPSSDFVLLLLASGASGQTGKFAVICTTRREWFYCLSYNTSTVYPRPAVKMSLGSIDYVVLKIHLLVKYKRVFLASALSLSKQQ